MKILNILESTKISDDEVEKLVMQIDEQSKPFIKAYGGWKGWFKANNGRRHQLYRGMKRMGDQPGVKNVRKDRAPKDTQPFSHKVIDKWFEENFGHPFRTNAVFAVGSASEAGDYGMPYSIFPIGQYDTCYAKNIEDLWTEIPRMADNISRESKIKRILNILKHGEYKLNAPLDEIIQSKHEVMIACKSYFFIPAVMTDFDGPFTKKVSELLEQGKIK